MDSSSADKEKLEEFDICVKCGAKTKYKKTDNIVFRSGYIEGAGQLCFLCDQPPAPFHDNDPEWMYWGG